MQHLRVTEVATGVVGAKEEEELPEVVWDHGEASVQNCGYGKVSSPGPCRAPRAGIQLQEDLESGASWPFLWVWRGERWHEGRVWEGLSGRRGQSLLFWQSGVLGQSPC